MNEHPDSGSHEGERPPERLDEHLEPGTGSSPSTEVDAGDEARPPTEELIASNPNASGPQGLSGGMGVSSERVGPVGPGQVGTDGVRDATVPPPNPDEPPEQHPGNPEENPVGIPPKPHHPEHNPGHSGS